MEISYDKIQSKRRERLENERWMRENNYGLGSFHDGQNRQRIEEIDRQLAVRPE